LRQDADDASDPERIERQVRAIDVAGGDLALLGCRVRVPGAVTDGMRRYLDWLDACVTPEDCAREIWIESPLVHPTVLARAGAIAAAGGYRDRLWPEDYDLWLRVHRAGGRMANLPDRLYEWNDRPDRLSRTDPRYAPESFLRCRLHHLRRWLATRAGPDRPLVVWGAGRDGRRFVREWDREASGEGPPAPPVVAFVDIDPEKVGRSRFGRPVLDFAAARAGFPGAFYLAAVGVAGARELIRELLREAGMVETVDFVCVH
ncbi:MAG: glycosyl transferase, partial [Candidatus Eisenbacteria bacterium]|nr:glycosyl transferase [Candidatus Eisenbacteria bacterium]